MRLLDRARGPFANLDYRKAWSGLSTRRGGQLALYASERHGGCQLDTKARLSDGAESQRRDRFNPVRKEDLFSALIKHGDLADPAERELFWRFARTLRQICHYEY